MYNIVVGKKDKNGKTRWFNIGSIIKNDKGAVFGVIESIPTGWDGWFNLFKPKQKGESDIPEESEPL